MFSQPLKLEYTNCSHYVAAQTPFLGDFAGALSVGVLYSEQLAGLALYTNTPELVNKPF